MSTSDAKQRKVDDEHPSFFRAKAKAIELAAGNRPVGVDDIRREAECAQEYAHAAHRWFHDPKADHGQAIFLCRLNSATSDYIDGKLNAVRRGYENTVSFLTQENGRLTTVEEAQKTVLESQQTVLKENETKITALTENSGKQKAELEESKARISALERQLADGEAKIEGLKASLAALGTLTEVKEEFRAIGERIKEVLQAPWQSGDLAALRKELLTLLADIKKATESRGNQGLLK